MYSVYQHWDPLRICLVGKTYPPEFYSWIQNSRTRDRFEKLACETEEDYQGLIRLLEKFGVAIRRPEIPSDHEQLCIDGKWIQPPTAPRDYFLMIHEEFWIPRVPNLSHAWSVFYRKHRQHGWPDIIRPRDAVTLLPDHASALLEQFAQFQITDQRHLDHKLSFYQNVFDEIAQQGNAILHTDLDFINGCFVSRIGHHLFFATQDIYDDKQTILTEVNTLFSRTDNRVVDARGHGDAVYCPVCPGLIISLNDVPTYQDTFPDWEVVYLPPSDYAHMRQFEASMKHNKGRWFMPGFEKDTNLINMVDYYFDEWVGHVAETVFDVNLLMIDKKNVVASAENDVVAQACARHGVEMHVVPFRHKYFWDCGIHCITNDIHRQGQLERFL